MTRARTLTENLHATGIAAIWQLHMAAADAHQTGHPAAAGAILEIAEAAEAAAADGERTRTSNRAARGIVNLALRVRAVYPELLIIPHQLRCANAPRLLIGRSG